MEFSFRCCCCFSYVIDRVLSFYVRFDRVWFPFFPLILVSPHFLLELFFLGHLLPDFVDLVWDFYIKFWLFCFFLRIVSYQILSLWNSLFIVVAFRTQLTKFVVIIAVFYRLFCYQSVAHLFYFIFFTVTWSRLTGFSRAAIGFFDFGLKWWNNCTFFTRIFLSSTLQKPLQINVYLTLIETNKDNFAIMWFLFNYFKFIFIFKSILWF